MQQWFSGDAAFSTSELRGEKSRAQRNKGWMGFRKENACARLRVQELWDGKFRPRAENGISRAVKGCSVRATEWDLRFWEALLEECAEETCSNIRAKVH